jgi:hypothetical protein
MLLVLEKTPGLQKNLVRAISDLAVRFADCNARPRTDPEVAAAL